MVEMARQLTLPIGLKRRTRLDRFIVGPNAPALAAVGESIKGEGEPLIYLWGRAATGKSHLLLGAAAEIAEQGGTPAYLPLRDAETLDPAMLDGLERMALVCLDDIESIAGQAAWEEGLFDLFNRLRAASVPLLVSAAQPPTELPLTLPDLASRLTWGATFHLAPLDDNERRTILIDAARELGMTLPRASAEFLLRHYSRDPHRLIAFLDRLDAATLAAQHRPTIPFIKRLLEAPETAD